MENIEVKGLRFSVEVIPDEDMGPPWKEHDGHGVVVRARHKPAAAHLRPLGNGDLLYDMTATFERAEEEGWGVSVAELAEKLGRTPTAREVTLEAIERDFARLDAWCKGEWEWVGVRVTLLDLDGEPTNLSDALWGIESDSPEYHEEVAVELAEQIAPDGAFHGARRIRPSVWPDVFIEWPPNTRVRVLKPMADHYEAGAEGIILTHSNDGCTLIAFDKPLKSLATKTKPADAWWAQTEDMERIA